MNLVILLIVLLFLFGGGYGYHAGWHFGLCSGLGGRGGILLLVLIVLLLSGRL